MAEPREQGFSAEKKVMSGEGSDFIWETNRVQVIVLLGEPARGEVEIGTW